MCPQEANPTRAAAQIASGVGFLSAGVILRDGLNIRGLNTAATLWCAAAADAMAGAGFLVPAVASSLLILGTNLFLRQLTSKFEALQDTHVRREVRYEVHVLCDGHGRQHVRAVVLATIRASMLVLVPFQSAMLDAGQQYQIVTELTAAERSDEAVEELIARLSTAECVVSAAWQCTADPSQRSDAAAPDVSGMNLQGQRTCKQDLWCGHGWCSACAAARWPSWDASAPRSLRLPSRKHPGLPHSIVLWDLGEMVPFRQHAQS
jgi:putative Mg2+ transporter-C (MgtC) family protein